MVENRLAKETSTYLRGAAHQPVDWYPWGEEAFRRAKELDRPILLDIGATWCHWCHVIDRESYEDPDLAKIINEHFVAVKVDRDERPDIDARYQQAVGAIAGQGGWPLTGFLTPDGKVFYGGTYFPPKDAFGRPSFRRVLLAMSESYRTNKADAVREAESLHQALAEGRVSLADEGVVNEAMLKESLDSLRGQFDPVNGGITGQQKFPHAGTMEWVMARYRRTREEGLKTIFTRTLTAMARGGVYDQIGGGFHRYSTDPQWIVPHFEKMLYDNAGLLGNYVHAWQLTHEPLFRETAEGILAWATEVLSDRMAGGFYASQDADVGLDDDGDYFTWTLDELRAALGPRIANNYSRHFSERIFVSFRASRSAGSGTLQGTTNLAVINGIVTFTTLSHNIATNITVAFASGSLSGATSIVVAVSPAAASRLTIRTQPSATATAGVAFAQQPVVRIEDGIEIRRQPGLDVRWEVPGGENPGFAGCHKHYPPCAALPQAIIVVFRGHGYYAWLPGYKA